MGCPRVGEREGGREGGDYSVLREGETEGGYRSNLKLLTLVASLTHYHLLLLNSLASLGFTIPVSLRCLQSGFHCREFRVLTSRCFGGSYQGAVPVTMALS